MVLSSRSSRRLLQTALCITGAAVFLASPNAYAAPIPSSAAKAVLLGQLKEGQKLGGFQAVSLYLDASDKPIGVRFRHLRTGFIFDFLQIESVPQVFIWVNTPPTSDKGEPHTQEHLLLGKGNKGRYASSLEAMSLAQSSAYTQQWRTCYFFNTTAGADVFYKLLQTDMDALLHPDYTDEEVRREVRNFGITENPDKTLRLEEKGTVYNEMVSTTDKPYSPLYRAIGFDLYGTQHPLAFDSGGYPAALRTLTPAEIRKFHDHNYYLGNMGMVGAFPKAMSLPVVLQRVNDILNRLQPEGIQPGKPVMAEPKFPAPQPAASGNIQVVAYPDKNEQQPGQLLFAWPATRNLDTTQYLLLQLFLDNFAGDADTPLYKRFVDTKTRVMETGATGVYAYPSTDQGQPVYVGFNDIVPAHLNDHDVKVIRQKVQAELARIASLKDGSPELLAFNERLHARLVAYKRGLSKFVNSPPGFGFRNTDSGWMDQLRLLEREPTFRKSVLMKPETTRIEAMLAGRKNIWRTLLPTWKLTGATPYAVGVKPNAALVAQGEAQREARIAAETAHLKKHYGTNDPQAAIRHYRVDYDVASAHLASAAKKTPPLHFTDTPPLTLDDSLEYRQTHLSSGIPMFVATFNNMTSATTTLSLRLDGVDDRDLVYLSLLPTLLDNVGVVENGKPLSYEEASQKQRKEILSLSAYFSTNPTKKRYELTVSGAGNDAREAQRSVEWMRLLLTAPNWRASNLPRLRDVVDQTLQGLRNTPQGAEESWVNGISYAYYWQRDPLALTTGSFLTQTHDAFRLRWMLKDAPAADRATLTACLNNLAGAGANASRADLKALLTTLEGSAKPAPVPAALQPYADAYAKLPASAKLVAADAAHDLDKTLEDLPDDSLGGDWAYLCQEMGHGLAQGPEETLRKIDVLRKSLLRTSGARLSVVGSAETQRLLQPSIAVLTKSLAATPVVSATRSEEPRIATRLKERIPAAQSPVFVGLFDPNLQGGVIMNSAPSASYTTTDNESLLRLLAFNLYGGAGAEGVFIKTWGAGLAYSNGIGSDLESGRVRYYAERTPEIPQTIRFVVDLLKNAKQDPQLVEFSMANLFHSRAASGYESRAASMSANLADELTPDVVKAFNKRLIQLHKMPGLTAAVYKRLPDAVGPVLPGYSTKEADVAGGSYVVIGSEKQFAAYDSYLKETEGPETNLYRLYPRDFWIPGE